MKKESIERSSQKFFCSFFLFLVFMSSAIQYIFMLKLWLLAWLRGALL